MRTYTLVYIYFIELTVSNLRIEIIVVVQPVKSFSSYWNEFYFCGCYRFKTLANYSQDKDNCVKDTISLRKHAYSNILKILPSKNEDFQEKKSDICHISAQNIDCGYSLEPPRRGNSNEYPQSMFLSRSKKIMYTLVNPSFTIEKWALRGSKL